MWFLSVTDQFHGFSCLCCPDFLCVSFSIWSIQPSSHPGAFWLDFFFFLFFFGFCLSNSESSVLELSVALVFVVLCGCGGIFKGVLVPSSLTGELTVICSSFSVVSFMAGARCLFDELAGSSFSFLTI